MMQLAGGTLSGLSWTSARWVAMISPDLSYIKSNLPCDEPLSLVFSASQRLRGRTGASPRFLSDCVSPSWVLVLAFFLADHRVIDLYPGSITQSTQNLVTAGNDLFPRL